MYIHVSIHIVYENTHHICVSQNSRSKRKNRLKWPCEFPKNLGDRICWGTGKVSWCRWVQIGKLAAHNFWWFDFCLKQPIREDSIILQHMNFLKQTSRECGKVGVTPPREFTMNWWLFSRRLQFPFVTNLQSFLLLVFLLRNWIGSLNFSE